MVSTNVHSPTEALYHPFHLCHARTLEALLHRFRVVHFRDYMAIQLTPLSGTMAYQDRMGESFPDLVQTGRLVQGYCVSGTLSSDIHAAIDRDLTDTTWRALCHDALRSDRRFQRGLFDFSHAMIIGRTQIPGPAALLALLADHYVRRHYTVTEIQRLSLDHRTLDQAYAYEYGMALLKTAAASAYTLELATRHRLAVATDSVIHARLLVHTCGRDSRSVVDHLIDRQGY